MKRIKKLINIIFDKLGIDPKEYITGMLVHLLFFMILAAAMIIAGVWNFDIILVYLFGGGIIVSAFFNLLNPSNRKK